jgi:hypothetical protein
LSRSERIRRPPFSRAITAAAATLRWFAIWPDLASRGRRIASQAHGFSWLLIHKSGNRLVHLSLAVIAGISRDLARALRRETIDTRRLFLNWHCCQCFGDTTRYCSGGTRQSLIPSRF